MTIGKVEISGVKSIDNKIQISWIPVANTDVYIIKKIEYKDGDEIDIEIGRTTANFFELNAYEFSDQIKLKIFSKSGSEISEPKNFKVYSDAFDQGNKTSVNFFIDSLKQYFSISSLIIAGSIAFLPLFFKGSISPILTYWYWSIIFFSLTALLSIMMQLYLVNEAYRNRFNIRKRKLIGYNICYVPFYLTLFISRYLTFLYCHNN